MTEERATYSTALTKVNDVYYPMIEKQLVGNGIDMDDYQKQCVINGISAINNALDSKGIKWNDSQLDQSNVTTTLLTIASLKLNASANPREVYFQLRNIKTKENGKDVWKKQIELGIEGDGNDAILSNFGRNVKEVRQFWEVREGDEFEYPSFNGLEMTPPKWTPKGKGKVIRVVYPIIKNSGAVEFHIAEREDVIKNLVAHVSNNLMNETFGIAESRFKANTNQKQQIDDKKRELVELAKELGLEGSIKSYELQKYISPAWKDPQSRESMIVRKMRNNIVKKIPKDFGSAFTGLVYDKASDDERVRKEINENANKEMIDIDVPDKKEPKKEKEQNTEEEKVKPMVEKEKIDKEDIIDMENISEDEVPF